ncbi:neuropeptide y receptor-like [Plakobranchus ocellatus]|uniref:Neuropeptide y receptor-like n=1 Tax=Plakobranchus ocellatus TaxID=259542 RepID=A0AAV4CK72_9GAST|nr:neuropeptide y receptor-like [Plakobranchus ocellatus]
MATSITLIINTTNYVNGTYIDPHRYSYNITNDLRGTAGTMESGSSSNGDNGDINDNYSNVMQEPGQQPLYAQVIIVLMYVLIIIVAVGGNLLFSYVIVMRAKMPSVTNLFLLNLAISDLMKAIICNPFTFMANLIWNYWPYGEFMCPVDVISEIFTLIRTNDGSRFKLTIPKRSQGETANHTATDPPSYRH